MSSLNCSRLGCSSIWCNTYVIPKGWICNNCKDEFKEYLEQSGLDTKIFWLRSEHLRDFMETKKLTYSEIKQLGVDEYLKNN